MILAKRFFSYAAACAMLPCAAYAFSVTPPRNDLTLGQAVTITINNAEGKKPLTYDASILKRFVKQDGNWDTKPDDGSAFVVIPPSGIVPPGSSQALRVQYVGEIKEKSLHYYLNVKEVSVDTEESVVKQVSPGVTATIKLAFAYNVGLNVYPPSSQENLVLVSAVGGKFMPVDSKNTNAKRVPAVELTVDNQGGKHAYIDQHLVSIDTAKKPIELTAQDLQKVNGTTLLPGMMRRTLLVPVSEALPASPLKATLK